MKTAHQQRIEEMMDRMGQAVPKEPTIPNEDVRKLRAKLIMEECLETIDALGVVIRNNSANNYIYEDALEFIADGEPNLVEIADGCADISVVTIGTLSACGIEDNDLLEVVDANNLTKFGPGSYRRDDGKWMKPPDFVGPDIEGIIGCNS